MKSAIYTSSHMDCGLHAHATSKSPILVQLHIMIKNDLHIQYPQIKNTASINIFDLNIIENFNDFSQKSTSYSLSCINRFLCLD